MADHSDNEVLLDWQELFKRRGRERLEKKALIIRRKRAVIIGLVTLAFGSLIVGWWLYSNETESKWKVVSSEGDTLNISRSVQLPVSLPKGDMKLISLLPSTKDGLSPFVAYSHSRGKLHVLTNATHPHCTWSYLAWFIEDPRVQDVVMLTDDFFCVGYTCFHVNVEPGHNLTHEKVGSVTYLNLTDQMTEVPLPTGAHFHSAEYCSPQFQIPCHIAVEYDNQVLRFGTIANPWGAVPSIEMSSIAVAGNQFYAFQMSAGPKQAWQAWLISDRLVVFDTDQFYQVSIYPVNLYPLKTVKIIPMGSGQQLVTVMCDWEFKTTVQTYTLNANAEIVAQDRIVINNRASSSSSITVLIRDDTFEICHLSGAQIECYAKTTA